MDCQTTQLRVDERQQFARCGAIALLNLIENLRNLGHLNSNSARLLSAALYRLMRSLLNFGARNSLNSTEIGQPEPLPLGVVRALANRNEQFIRIARVLKRYTPTP